MTGNLILRKISFVVTVSAASLLVSCIAQAQSPGLSASKPAFSSGFVFTEKSGEQLFSSVCRGCHMADGKGATGAGIYPSLAGDRNLEAGGYAVGLGVKRRRDMPPVEA